MVSFKLTNYNISQTMCLTQNITIFIVGHKVKDCADNQFITVLACATTNLERVGHVTTQIIDNGCTLGHVIGHVT